MVEKIEAILLIMAVTTAIVFIFRGLPEAGEEEG